MEHSKLLSTEDVRVDKANGGDFERCLGQPFSAEVGVCYLWIVLLVITAGGSTNLLHSFAQRDNAATIFD
jgi:hypothetical protein